MTAAGAGEEAMLDKSSRSNCWTTSSNDVEVAAAIGIDVGWNAVAGRDAGGRD
jgi:hypothetical protein